MPPPAIEEIVDVPGLSGVALAGRLQAVLRDDRARDSRVVRDLKLGEPLLANTLVAALLTADELRAHLYIVHEASEGKLVTVIGYAMAESLRRTGGPELRVPQDGAWLLCPTRGRVFVVASDRPLTRRLLSKLLHGRVLSPPPGSDDDVLSVP